MPNTQPHAIIVSGPNGAGKTTLALEYQKIHPFIYLSADAIAFELNKTEPAKVKIQAGRLFIQKVTSGIAKRDHLIIETTLAGKSFQRVIEQLNAAGYHTVLSFVFLQSPEACIARVAERTIKGGHYVPEEDVRRRYYRALNNFWLIYKQQVNEWHLFFNTLEEFIPISMGEKSNHTVMDDIGFALFLNSLGEIHE